MTCPLCGHVWTPRAGSKSRVCPGCHKTIIPAPPKRQLTCTRCGHVWDLRGVELPKVCPKCKSPYWNREYMRDPKTMEWL